MPSAKVHLSADGQKVKEGTAEAAFVVNASDADDFAKRLKANAAAESVEGADVSEASTKAK